MFRSVISFGTMSLKALLILNGGAATVLLAFISRVAATEGIGSALVVGLAPSMKSFVAGLIVAVLAVASAYVTQFRYQHYRSRIATPFHVAAVASFLASLGAFSGARGLRRCCSAAAKSAHRPALWLANQMSHYTWHGWCPKASDTILTLKPYPCERYRGQGRNLYHHDVRLL